MCADRALRLRRELCHRQYFLAQYAGPARYAAGGRARRSSGARDRRARARAPHAGPTPVLFKIAPDLSLPDLDDVVGIARSRRVDGMIVGNTTVARPPGLREVAIAKEAGGLSGRPLLPLANRMLAETYVRVEGVFPLIGAGGIDTGAAALGQNPRRREPGSGLFGTGLLRPRPCRRYQARRCFAALDRDPPSRPRRLCRRRCGVRHRRAVAAVIFRPCSMRSALDKAAAMAADAGVSECTHTVCALIGMSRPDVVATT